MRQDIPGGSSNGTEKLVEIPVDKVMTTLLFFFPAVGGLLFGAHHVYGMDCLIELVLSSIHPLLLFPADTGLEVSTDTILVTL